MAEGTRVPQGGELHRQLVAAMSDLSGGPHEGRRTVHAKGVWAEGTFTGDPRGHCALSSAVAADRRRRAGADPILEGQRQARVARRRPRRRRDGGEAADTESDEWDIVAAGPPVFVARTPEDFLELLRLRKPDPETGQPDMEALGEFLGRHPEAQLAIQSTLGAEPPASFVTVPYFSPHAFALDRRRRRTRPGCAGAGAPSPARSASPTTRRASAGRNYLREELEARLAAGPAAMELIFQLAGRGRLADGSHRALARRARDRSSPARLEITARRRGPRGRRAHRGLRPDPSPGRDRAVRRPDPPRPAAGVLRLGVPPPRPRRLTRHGEPDPRDLVDPGLGGGARSCSPRSSASRRSSRC